MSSNILLTTKGTNKASVTRGIIIGIVGVIIAIIVATLVAGVSDRISRRTYGTDEGFVLVIYWMLPLIPLMIGVVSAALSIKWSNAYIDLYETHIEGTAFNKQGIKNSIYLTYADINNITIEGNWICIHTASEIFKVRSSETDKIFSIYKSKR